jgi:hypothetical protein
MLVKALHPAQQYTRQDDQYGSVGWLCPARRQCCQGGGRKMHAEVVFGPSHVGSV